MFVLVSPIQAYQEIVQASLLPSYNIREKDISVLEIAIHRALAVTAGVLWAALVSRFWWPSEARRELSKGLGE